MPPSRLAVTRVNQFRPGAINQERKKSRRPRLPLLSVAKFHSPLILLVRSAMRCAASSAAISTAPFD